MRANYVKLFKLLLYRKIKKANWRNLLELAGRRLRSFTEEKTLILRFLSRCVTLYVVTSPTSWRWSLMIGPMQNNRLTTV